ncbi:MAG: flagellin [Limnohabitans sp.]
MQIGSNSASLMAVNALNSANAVVLKASERISTGLRINRASDDPTGLMAANRFKTQITSMAKAIDNLSQGSAATQIVDSSLSQMVEVLGNMRVAAVASQSSTLSTSDRGGYQDAIDAYVSEIDNIADNAVWNGSSLMNTASSMSVQASAQSGDTIAVSFQKVTSTQLSLGSLSMSSASDASSAVTAIDAAIETIGAYQSYMGAMSNVMTIQSDALTSFSTSYSTAYGNIMNADLAQETANLASGKIQRDASTAMLAQSQQMSREIVDYLLKSVQ